MTIPLRKIFDIFPIVPIGCLIRARGATARRKLLELTIAVADWLLAVGDIYPNRYFMPHLLVLLLGFNEGFKWAIRW